MKIIYTENLRQSNELYALVQQTIPILEEIVGQLVFPVIAEWDCGTDEQGRPVASLRLFAVNEAATLRFSPAELKDAANVDARLSDLWSDLLESISHKQIEALLKSIGNPSPFENARQDQQ